MGQWPAENSFLLRLLDRLGGVCRRAGGRSVGWSGGAAGLGHLLASVPPRLGRLSRHSSRLGSWAGAGAGAEKRRLPRESRDTSGDIRRDGRQTWMFLGGGVAPSRLPLTTTHYRHAQAGWRGLVLSWSWTSPLSPLLTSPVHVVGKYRQVGSHAACYHRRDRS